ncbi:Ferredoxin 2Fe-2S [Salmonella enterica subsp. enterica serovar Baildon str. R6-199]|nr:Ferredoxin 2Fe-2S [Salmonella enterica subsp. enterica serovar Baildon str. R6-199]
MPKIVILPHQDLCPDGAVLEAETGETILDVALRKLRNGIEIEHIALRNGIEIEHACEKSCACTTCHCIVREGFDSLPESSEEEDDMLDKAWGLEPESRLSCQARVTDDDLVIEIPRYTINHAREH